MDLEGLRRVEAIVRTFVPSSFDRESLAVDICLESWENRIERPSWEFVRHRCYDALRRAKRERLHLAAKAREPHETFGDLADAKSEVASLVRVLSPLERRVVFFRFYLDLPIVEIAKRLKLDLPTVRDNLASAIYKMKQEAWS